MSQTNERAAEAFSQLEHLTNHPVTRSQSSGPRPPLLPPLTHQTKRNSNRSKSPNTVNDTSKMSNNPQPGGPDSNLAIPSQTGSTQGNRNEQSIANPSQTGCTQDVRNAQGDTISQTPRFIQSQHPAQPNPDIPRVGRVRGTTVGSTTSQDFSKELESNRVDKIPSLEPSRGIQNEVSSLGADNRTRPSGLEQTSNIHSQATQNPAQRDAERNISTLPASKNVSFEKRRADAQPYIGLADRSRVNDQGRNQGYDKDVIDPMVLTGSMHHQSVSKDPIEEVQFVGQRQLPQPSQSEDYRTGLGVGVPEIICTSDNRDHQSFIHSDVPSEKEIEDVMFKIRAAARDGDGPKAESLMKVYDFLVASRSKPTITRSHSADETSIMTRPTISDTSSMRASLMKRSNSDLPPSIQPSGKIQKIGAVTFERGAVITHQLLGLTPHFHEKFSVLQGTLPLMVFLPKWLKLAHADLMARPMKKSKDRDGALVYTGYKYGSDWDLSFREWDQATRHMGELARKVYDFHPFADGLEEHRETVKKLQVDYGWPCAYRYCMKVRHCVFTHKIGETTQDIGRFRPEYELEARVDTEKAGDMHFEDNPYAKGQERYGWDPITGEPPDDSKNNRVGQAGKAKSFNNNNNDRGEGSSQGNQGNKPSWRERRRGGYGGRNSNSDNDQSYKGNRFNSSSKDGKKGKDSDPKEKDNSGRDKDGNKETSQRKKSKTHHHSESTTQLRVYSPDKEMSPIPELDKFMELPIATPSVIPPVQTNDTPAIPAFDIFSVNLPGWPKTVKNEMNFDVWKSALEEAGLLPEYNDVLVGLVEGFHQGIPDHRLGDRRYFTPPNHSSAKLAESDIREAIKLELSTGRMAGPYSVDLLAAALPFFRTSPMGAVINGDGTLRTINDLSFPRNDPSTPSVNSFVNKDDFETTWDDFRTVASFFCNLSEPVLLALFDWHKAYRQLSTHPSQWPFLMVLDPDGKVLLDMRIAFGGVAGCGSFGRPADAWKLVMKFYHDLIQVFRWVDDALFVKSLESPLSMRAVVDHSLQMGVQTNPSKFSDFAREQKFIGFIWNGVDKTVRLPDAKLSDRISQVLTFLMKDAKFSYDEVEVFVGRLNHVTLLLPQMKCYLRGLYRWMKSWVHLSARRSLPEDAGADLRRWHHTLCTFEPTRLIPSPTPQDIHWVGDASTEFGIGVIVGSVWAQFQHLPGWEESGQFRRGIAWLETVAIRLGFLILKQQRDVAGKTFYVWTDNTTSQSALNKRSSRDDSVNEEWSVIQDMLIANQTDIQPLRVTSAENKADGLSRGLLPDLPISKQVKLTVPGDLALVIEQVWHV